MPLGSFGGNRAAAQRPPQMPQPPQPARPAAAGTQRPVMGGGGQQTRPRASQQADALSALDQALVNAGLPTKEAAAQASRPQRSRFGRQQRPPVGNFRIGNMF